MIIYIKYYLNILKVKNLLKKNIYLSSIIGIIINIYLFLIYIIGYTDYSDTKLQLILIFSNTFIYLFVYLILKND